MATTWEPVGFTVFFTDFSDPLAVLRSTLPLHRSYRTGPGPDPDSPHAPPYDSEMIEGVAAEGFTTGNCSPESVFEPPNARIVGFLIVPREGAPLGTSPDYASGPILATCDGREAGSAGAEDCPDEVLFDIRVRSQSF